MIIPILVKERSVERRLPWTKGGIAEEVLNLQLPSWKLIFQKLVKVVFMPVSIMMGFAAFSFSIIAGILMAALPVFAVQELEWSDNQFALLLSIEEMFEKSFANFFLCLTESFSSQFSTAVMKFSLPISSLINSASNFICTGNEKLTT